MPITCAPVESLRSFTNYIVLWYGIQYIGLLTYIIKVSLGYVHITGQGLEVVVRLLGAEVACTQDVLDLAWHLEKVCVWGGGGGF